MPSAVFPRTYGVEGTTAFGVPAGLRRITNSGKVNIRAGTMRGRTWLEQYAPMFIGSVNAESFLAWVRWAWNTQSVFTIKHQTTPGSGIAPNGTGTGGVTVDGASQSGSSIVTTGWPTSTSNVARAGDLIKIAGVGSTLQITDDANSDGAGDATLYINPPIFVGGEPSNGAAVTTTNVDISAVILEEPNWPPVQNAFWYEGFSLTFREAP